MRSAAMILLTACATTSVTSPKGGPRGLHATEHLDVAHQHEDQARRERTLPDATTAGPGISGVAWTMFLDAGADHERLAAIHRSQAEELQAAYDEACAGRLVTEAAISPLRLYGIGSRNTATGVIIYLAGDAGPADRLLADTQCHRAWMRLAPHEDMDNCPLDLPGLELAARGNADVMMLTITIADPALVHELQRRAAQNIESPEEIHRTLAP